MKTLQCLFFWLSALSVIFNASKADTTEYRFESLDDFSTQFRANGTSNNFSFSSLEGIEQGAVAVGFGSSSDALLAVNPVGAFTTGSRLEVSVFWKFDESKRDPGNWNEVIRVGFSETLAATQVGFQHYLTTKPSSAGIQGGIGYKTSAGGGVGTSGGSTWSITSGSWYQTMLQLEFRGGPFDLFDWRFRTVEYGASGQIPGRTLYDQSRTYGIPYLATLETLYVGVQAAGNSGTVLIDNLSVTAVPEPASTVPAVLALSVLAAARRYWSERLPRQQRLTG